MALNNAGRTMCVYTGKRPTTPQPISCTGSTSFVYFNKWLVDSMNTQTNIEVDGVSSGFSNEPPNVTINSDPEFSLKLRSDFDSFFEVEAKPALTQNCRVKITFQGTLPTVTDIEYDFGNDTNNQTVVYTMEGSGIKSLVFCVNAPIQS